MTEQKQPNPAITIVSGKGIALSGALVMTPQGYAEATCQEEGVVRGHIEKGYLPTVKHGRYRLINLVALAIELAEARINTIH